MPLLDSRPDAVDQLIRPGVTYTLTLPWPTGELAGRSFSSTLDGVALALTVVGDTMTIEATDTITGALDLGVPVQFLLLEDIDGTDEPILVGTWTPSNSPRAVSSSTVTVAVGAATIEVTVNSSQASIAGLDARLDAAETNITALQTADVTLDARVDDIEALDIVADSRNVVTRWSQALSQLGAVLFVWDDGWASAMDAAAINEARGQQATFAITTQLVGTAGKITAAQVAELEARGHEIAAHGAQHTTGLPSLTAAQRAAEYVECLDWFEANGVSRPSTWVYTFGGATGRSDDTDRELWLRVDRILDTSGSSALGASTRRDQFGFGVKRLQAESDTAGVFDTAKTLIRLAAQQPVVVAFYMHQLGDLANSLSVAEYTELCDLCVDLGVPVITARDALPRNHMLVDGGFEETNAIGLWMSQTTGTSTATTEADTPVVGLPGTKSLHLRTVDTGAFEFSQVFQYCPVVPGRVYTVSGRYRTSSGAGTAGRVRFGSYDHKGVIIGSATTTTLAEATAWTRFALDFTAASEAVMAQIALLNDPAALLTTDVWFDHICCLPKAAGAFG